MSFYVGQRVKLRYVRNIFWMKLVGTEGTIVGKADLIVSDDHMHPGQFLVAWDSTPRHGLHAADQLEPIVPDGLESLDRINELYEPEPEVIRA